MPAARLELARTRIQQILSLPRLPFRHAGIQKLFAYCKCNLIIFTLNCQLFFTQFLRFISIINANTIDFQHKLVYTEVVIWLVGQAVKTPPSHGGNRGSIPLRAAFESQFILRFFFYFSDR